MVVKKLNDTYIYTGKTFCVRETREEDTEVWYKWFNDPEITKKLLHGVVPNTIENQKEFRSRHINGKDKVIFSLVTPDSGELIGTCSINIFEPRLNGYAEISLVIGNKKYQKGSTYLEITSWQLDHAFFMMNMHSVFAATSARNEAVIATLEYLGFKKCGVMRERSYSNGQYHDTVLFDILKDEWGAVKKG